MHIKNDAVYLKKYLVICICVIFVPILVFSGFAYYFIKESTQKLLLEKQEKALTASRFQLDSQFAGSIQITHILSIEKQIKALENSAFSPVDASEIQKLLGSYVLANDSTYNIVLYIAGHPYVYSARGIYPIENSVISPVLDNGQTIGKYLESIDNFTEFSFHTYTEVSKGSYPMLLYASKLSTKNDKPGMVIGVLFNVNTLAKSFIFSSDPKSNYLFYMTLSGEKIIYMHSTIPEFSPPDTDNGVFSKEMIEKAIDTSKYYSVQVSSDYMPITFNMLLAKKAFVPQMANTYILFLITMIVWVISGICFIHMFIKADYKPIKQLRGIAQSIIYQFDNGISAPKNEISYVLYTLYAMKSYIVEQRDCIESLGSAAKRAILRQIIETNGNSGNNLIKSGALPSAVNLNFAGEFYFIFIIYTSSSKYDEVIGYVEGYTDHNTSLYGFTELDQKCVFIANSLIGSFEYIKEYMDTIYENIYCKFTDISISVSTASSDIHNMKLLYYQAKAVLESRVQVIPAVLFFDEINLNRSYKSLAKMNTEWSDKIIKAIEQRNYVLLSETLEKFIDILAKKPNSGFYTQYLCYEVIHSAHKAISKFANTPNTNLSILFDSNVLSSLHLFKDYMLEISAYAFSTYAAGESQPPPLSITAIEAYVALYYCNLTFSIQSVAEHFGISISKLSHYFKKEYSSTLIEYITKKRIEQAKRLLQSSSLTLADIVEQIGYYSTSTFIQKFKSIEGITPGEFRQKYGRGQM